MCFCEKMTNFEIFIDKFISDKYGEDFKNYILYMTYFGSKLYGTETSNSDIDIRGIYLPKPDDVLYAAPLKIYNHNTECFGKKVDIQFWPLQKFFHYLEKNDTNAIDMLYSYTLENNFRYYKINKNIDERVNFLRFLNKNYLINMDKDTTLSCINYVISQQHKYQEKIDNINIYKDILRFLNSKNIYRNYKQTDIEKENKLRLEHFKNDIIDIVKEEQKEEDFLSIDGRRYYDKTPIEVFYHIIEDKINQYGKRVKDNFEEKDWKSISHSMRVLFQIEELMDTSQIKFPNKYANALKSIKNGYTKYELIEKTSNIIYNRIVNKFKNNEYNFKAKFNKDYVISYLKAYY